MSGHNVIDDEPTVKLELSQLQFKAIVELVCRADRTLDYDPATSELINDGSLLVNLMHQKEKQE